MKNKSLIVYLILGATLFVNSYVLAEVTSFTASPNVSDGQPISLDWEATGGLAIDLNITCADSKMGFWNNLMGKVYHCGETVISLPLMYRFNVRPQDYNVKTPVTFKLFAESFDYKSTDTGKSVIVDFNPAPEISPGYAQYVAQVLPPSPPVAPVPIPVPAPAPVPVLAVVPPATTMPIPPPPSLPVIFSFNYDLIYGMKNNNEVKELQKILKSLKLYNGKITGSFYELTMKAVKKFQTKNKIKPTGYVGPATRKKLNESKL